MNHSPRVLILGFFHEANAFAPVSVDQGSLESAFLNDQQTRRIHGGADTVIAGYLEATEALGWVPTIPFTCELVPSGLLDDLADEALLSRFDDVLGAAAADVVLLCLHGSAASRRHSDLDGVILAKARAALPDAIIVATLDLHANVTDLMVDSADLLVGYRTNPHVDARTRAVHAVEVAERLWSGEQRQVVDVRLPVAPGILAQGTSSGIMRDLFDRLDRLDVHPLTISTSLFEGFPWADGPEIGMRILSYTAVAAGLEHELEAIAAEAWRRRAEFVVSAPDAPTAVRSLGAGRTLLLDVGDNIGGGAGGRSTVLLAAAMDANVHGVLAIVVDPAAAETCARARGKWVEVAVGEPVLRVRGRVLASGSGQYEDGGPTHVGHRYFDAGTSVLLDLGDRRHVIITSRPVMPSSTAQLAALGTSPDAYDVIIAKGVHSPLASYGPHVDSIVFADTPGSTSNDLKRLGHRHRPVPLFPWEDAFPSDLTARRIPK